MSDKHIAVLGCGKRYWHVRKCELPANTGLSFMGTALIKGMLLSSGKPKISFTACVRSQASADRLKRIFVESQKKVEVVLGELAASAGKAT